MGVSAAMVKAALEFKRAGLFDGVQSVMEMGSQELHLEHAEFDHLMRAYGVAYDAAVFDTLKSWPGWPRLSSRHLWMALGATTSHCLDINGEHGAITCDLNEPFENREYWSRYDLVTDCGNNEHPFNVAEAYRTMHRLCKPGGLMWIDQAVIKGNGYFNFDQAFFEGMAAANHYGVIYSAFVVTTADGSKYHMPCSRQVLDLFDFSKVIHLGVNYLFRKGGTDDFRFPVQGKPDPITPDQTYKVAYVDNRFPPERYYVPSGAPENFGARTLARELVKRLKQKLF